MNSSEMIFTENELQILANALVVLLKFTENNGSDLGNFVNISGLLNRMNAELDDIEFKRIQEMVKYEDNFYPRTFNGKEYSYYTNISLNIGDLTEVPTKYGSKIAKVTRINVLENEIKDIKPYMKSITRKIDRNRYINFYEIQEDAA